MDKKSVEEKEARFAEIMNQPPYPVDEMLELIADVPTGKGEEWSLAGLKALSDAGDFVGTFKFVCAVATKEVVGAKLQGPAVRDALKKATKDRLILSFVDSVGFGARPLKDALDRLGRLLSFVPGARVLSDAWGLGEVRRLDAFYRRVTVDFRTRKGHQLTYDAACETLVLAPEDHILVLQKADPGRVETMMKDRPGDFVKKMLGSFGNVPVTRLEELCAQHAFIKAGEPWKKFWERARADLRKDRLVEIPTRRSEPLVLKAKAEDYGDLWFTAFEHQKDPKAILTAVKELETTARMKNLDDSVRAKIAERLVYALVGSRKVDNALYIRIACCLDELGMDADATAKARIWLWGYEPGHNEGRYLSAARDLPARDMDAFVRFLVKDDPDARKAELFAVLPDMCFPFLSATLDNFKEDAACEDAVATLLRSPSAPATVVTLVLGRYKDFKHWTKLPALVVILTHAIALGEGRQSGETLRMQNMIRRLFADQKWLKEIFAQLDSADQALFFERFQASIAWDPSTHHTIVVRMTHLVPALAARQVQKVEVKAVERITSLRSYAERKAAYLKLVNVDMPKNAHDIDVARGYGDLRENFEYQSAKDEQRALMQKQTLMQDELNAVKATDFSEVVADEVRPGTMVTILTSAGEERTYTVLGEWDNDLEKGILSNKARLSENMLGKKVGDTFDLPDSEGNVSVATVKAIALLSDELRAWIQIPAGLSL